MSNTQSKVKCKRKITRINKKQIISPKSSKSLQIQRMTILIHAIMSMPYNSKNNCNQPTIYYNTIILNTWSEWCWIHNDKRQSITQIYLRSIWTFFYIVYYVLRLYCDLMIVLGFSFALNTIIIIMIMLYNYNNKINSHQKQETNINIKHQLYNQLFLSSYIYSA